MLEMLLVGVPIAFSALVFGAALVTVPHDIVFQEITAPNSLEYRGYPEQTLAALLEDKIDAIVDGAASLQVPKGIDTGLAEEPINAFLDTLGLSEPVRATQRLLGMVDYVVDINVLGSPDWNVVVTVRISDDELNTLELSELRGDVREFDALLDRAAREIMAVAEPYIMATYLYNTRAPDRSDVVVPLTYVKNMLPAVPLSTRPWFYNLLGRVAEDTDDLDLAVAYYERALSLNPWFPLAQTNLGRVYHRRGEYAKAVEHYRRALGSAEDLAIAHVYWAEAALAQGRFKQALAQLAEAQRIAPEFARIYEARAAILEHAGLPDRAEEQRQRAALARTREPRQGFYDAV